MVDHAKRKIEIFLLIVILIISAFMRLYRIRDYIVFLGDEGRDVIVVRNILHGDLTLLGPTASVGGFYLGPIYYYMMAPFLWLAGYDPAGPAYLIAILGIATVYMVYRFGKRFFHPIVGLSAAFLYSISPLTVRYSRASWNPNPLPFFTILGMYFLAVGLEKKQHKYIWLAGGCLGIVWQLHYLALILTGVYAIIIAWDSFISHKNNWRKFLIHSVLIFTGWVITFSPFLAFEVRHNFPNTHTVIEFVTRKNGAIDFKPIDIITTFWRRLTRLFFEAYTLPNSVPVKMISVVAAVTLIYASLKRNKVLLLWTLAGLSGMSLYQGDIHNYYFGLLFPVPFLLTGVLFHLLWEKGKITRLLALGFMLFLSYIYISKAFFQILPNRQLDQTKTVALMAIEFADGKPYNYALIATGNSDHAYRYFMDITTNPPVNLETQITEQLIVICEQPQETCQPLGNPIWEIAGFGRAETVEVARSPVGDISIFKLIHHFESENKIGKPATKG